VPLERQISLSATQPAEPSELIDLSQGPPLGWGGWKRLRKVGTALIGLQFVGLVLVSVLIYHRMGLDEDFGIYNQAWYLIAHGHLDPFDSIYQFSFLKSQFELIMWPMALLYYIYPHGIMLLWIQDLGAAACGLVVYQWCLEYLEQRNVSPRLAIIACASVLVALLVNPITYQTITSDFHLEPVSTLFALLAARELWRGRIKRAWIWVGFILLCGNLPSLYVIGLGLSAFLAGRAFWRTGLLLVVAGGAWLSLIGVIGANQASDISAYAYLAGRTTLQGGAIALIILGIITHPGRVLHEISSRLSDIYVFLKPAGVVGLASAWGFGIPVVVLLSSSLNSNLVYIIVPFQNFPVIPFVLIGTVMTLVWLGHRFRWGWIAAGVIGLAALVQALVFGLSNTPSVLDHPSFVAAGPATTLRSVLARTPPNAQVVATLRIIGEFSDRANVSMYLPGPGGQRVKINSRPIVVVIAPEYEIGYVTQQDSDAAISYFRHTLRANVLAQTSGIYAFEWHPPPGRKEFTIPAAHQ